MTQTPSSSSPSMPTGKREGTLFQALMAVLPETVLLADEIGRIEEWGSTSADIFGWGTGIPPPSLDLLFPDAHLSERLAELAIPARSTSPSASPPPAGPEQWVHLTARRRDGERFAAALRISRTHLDGQPHYLILVRDTTDALLAEQQLVQAQKLEALGHLTGGLAHDFNNILGIIIGSLELVIDGIRGGEERELTQAALNAARRGAEITHSLLAVARRRAIKPQACDINRLINELAPLLRQTAGKSVELMVSAEAREAICLIDPGALNNALINLVINARDATPAGGQILVYAYTTDILPRSLSAPLELPAGTYVVIGVDDNGCGMTPEVAMHAFDPFFTTKERGRGTGLGLAMVYGFARQSGGTARIQSAPGQGSSIQLFLPKAGTGHDGPASGLIP